MIGGRGRRGEAIIATKCGLRWDLEEGELFFDDTHPATGAPMKVYRNLKRHSIVEECERSLRRLGVETIDLYQCHWPDEDTPIEETLSAMEELVRAGKVRSAGVSNYTAAQLQEAVGASAAAGVPGFVSLQPHYNLVHRREYEADLEAMGMERDTT